MARIDVLMPQMGESIAEGTVSKWLKKLGDPVKRDEPLFEISTDKVDAEIPAPAAGVLAEIKVQQGETVPVQTLVAVIETDAGAVAPSAAAAAPPSAAAQRAPAASASPPLRRRPPLSAPSRLRPTRRGRAAMGPRPPRSGSVRNPPRWCARSRPSISWTSPRFLERGSPGG